MELGSHELRRIGTAYPENGLHLSEIRPGMSSREHLDDETAKTPDICFARVGSLLDYFGRHPVDGALKGGPVDFCSGKKVCSQKSGKVSDSF